ncbi:carbohydrate ABC transporter permease [Paenibacillus cymbidii]|uniref:carbohydrate ABC transporter permease n=1 Tax=Paenibacillus cymbidii TaxID=1639034 RepID=UPI001F1FE4B2|nr:carbohydrate ABC transporter permease [Paenibacillus cymbidii]
MNDPIAVIGGQRKGRTARRRTPLGARLFAMCNGLLLILFSLSILYPFWQTAVLSLSGPNAATTLGVHLWSGEWSLDAYRFLVSYEDIARAYWNSIVRTVLGSTLSVTFTVIAAYPLAKRNLPFRSGLTVYFLIPMFFSGGLIPSYLLIKSLGLLDNFLVLIIPPAVSIFSVLIMRNFFQTLDPAYEESALIDGAHYGTMLARVILPISLPVLATVVLWSAVSHWNAWFDAMIYIRDRDRTVIQMILRDMLTAVNQQAQDIVLESAHRPELTLNNVRAAVVLISIGPIVLVYPFLQKYFVKGITVGSLKG